MDVEETLVIFLHSVHRLDCRFDSLECHTFIKALDTDINV